MAYDYDEKRKEYVRVVKVIIDSGEEEDKPIEEELESE